MNFTDSVMEDDDGIIIEVDIPDGVGVGSTVGTAEGIPDGVRVGSTVGTAVGIPDGVRVGSTVGTAVGIPDRSEEHTSELQSRP